VLALDSGSDVIEAQCAAFGGIGRRRDESIPTAFHDRLPTATEQLQ
jgi:hypothetical protein